MSRSGSARSPTRSAIAVRVGAMRRIAVAAPGYLKRRGRPAVPADLAGHDVIAFAGIDRIERWRFAGGVEARIKPRLIVNTAEAAIDAAVAGFGITRVLSYQAADALSDRSAGAAAARSTKPARHRFTWSIRKAAIRRRSSAHFSMRSSRACGSVAAPLPAR